MRGTTWWIELGAAALVAVAYLLSPRNAAGEQLVAEAQGNAEALWRWQVALGLDVERGLQELVIGWGLAAPMNWLYGSLHFVVTAAVLVHLFRHRPEHYQRWRAGFVIASLLAFGIYRIWPVAPPRLLPGPDGSPVLVDTLAAHPRLWDFEQGLMSEVANHYAAMPSMHAGWALFCAMALGIGRGVGVRVLLLGYPLLTTVVIMATGNHFLVDALAGFAVVGAGLGIAAAGERLVLRRPVLCRPAAGGGRGGTDARIAHATGGAGLLRPRGALGVTAGPARGGR